MNRLTNLIEEEKYENNEWSLLFDEGIEGITDTDIKDIIHINTDESINLESYLELDNIINLYPDTAPLLTPLIDNKEYYTNIFNIDNFSYLTEDDFIILTDILQECYASGNIPKLNSIVWTKLYIVSNVKNYKFLGYLDRYYYFINIKFNTKLLDEYYRDTPYKDIEKVITSDVIKILSYLNLDNGEFKYKIDICKLLNELRIHYSKILTEDKEKQLKTLANVCKLYQTHGSRVLFDIIQETKRHEELGYTLVEKLLLVSDQIGYGDVYHMIFDDFSFSLSDEFINEYKGNKNGNTLMFEYSLTKNNGVKIKDIILNAIQNKYITIMILEYYLSHAGNIL